MSKAFREAFPTLKLEEELEGLLDTTEVTKKVRIMNILIFAFICVQKDLFQKKHMET